jgi:dienelactone hydrolase
VLDPERQVAHGAEPVGAPLAQTFDGQRDAGHPGVGRPAQAPAREDDETGHDQSGCHDERQRPRQQRRQALAAQHRHRDDRDLEGAVAFLRRRPDVDPNRIGGLGLSVGGEQMLEAAAENPALTAVVSDGAGERSVNETLARGPKAALAIPEAIVQTSAIAVFSAHRPPPSLTTVAPRISPRAALYIYAQHGIGGEDLNRTFYDRAHEPKQLWRVPAAGHTGGLQAAPHDYERRVVRFVLDHVQHLGR